MSSASSRHLLRLLPRTTPPPRRITTTTITTITTRTTTRTPTTPPRAYSSSSSSTTFRPSPSPPRLPATEQAEFERLQRAVADRFADPTPLPHEQPPPQSSSSSSSSASASASSQQTTAASTAGGQGREELPTTGGVWRGARPEFQGDTNPKTGEVGGPKTEPLRWGSAGDWSYNGRVTDF